LTILKGSIQDLLHEEFGTVPGLARRQIEIMKSNVDRLHRLAEQLLDLAVSKLPIPTSPLSLATSWTSCVASRSRSSPLPSGTTSRSTSTWTRRAKTMDRPTASWPA
jgi:signal transduction histidine kinase